MAIRLYATEDTENLPITVTEGKPYYVGARAYVEQLTDGAKITVIDKEGTTTAVVDDGFTPQLYTRKTSTGHIVYLINRSGTSSFSVDDGARGATGPRGFKGDTGDTGNGIASVTLNDDYTLTILFTESIRNIYVNSTNSVN